MSKELPLVAKKTWCVELKAYELPNDALTLGYRSHFGLGLFQPIMDSEAAQ